MVLFFFQKKMHVLFCFFKCILLSNTVTYGSNFYFYSVLTDKKRSNFRQTHRGNLRVVPSRRRRGCGRHCSRRLLGRRFHCSRLPQLPVGLQGGEVVDGRELDQGGEDESEADCDEPIHGRGVGNFGQGVAGADAESRHGQDGGDACGRRRRALAVAFFF